MILFNLFGTFYIFGVVPESPQWLYHTGDYDDSRRSLTRIANFNGVYKVDGMDYYKFKFNKENKAESTLYRHECSHDESDIL